MGNCGNASSPPSTLHLRAAFLVTRTQCFAGPGTKRHGGRSCLAAMRLRSDCFFLRIEGNRFPIDPPIERSLEPDCPIKHPRMKGTGFRYSLRPRNVVNWVVKGMIVKEGTAGAIRPRLRTRNVAREACRDVEASIPRPRRANVPWCAPIRSRHASHCNHWAFPSNRMPGRLTRTMLTSRGPSPFLLGCFHGRGSNPDA